MEGVALSLPPDLPPSEAAELFINERKDPVQCQIVALPSFLEESSNLPRRMPVVFRHALTSKLV
jgi:hypothetical protein